MARGLALLAVSFFASAVTASAAHAHGEGTHVGFVSTVSYVEPQVPGLLIRVLGGHERLSMRNLTQKTVVIFGANGRPALRLEPGDAGAVADPRIGSTGPPPEKGEFVKNWRIAGEADGKPFAIVGFLGYRAASQDEHDDETTAAANNDDDDDGTSRWTIALAVGGALVVAAALALPLRRRKGES